MSAARALIEMSAEHGSTTTHDSQEHFDVLPGDPWTASFDECLSRSANQIGHLEWWPIHLLLLGDSLFSDKESRGLAVAFR